ncbi:hypothetical protein TUSST3_12630 [Streptomyces sp. TUS-ST3]|nr:hypothetical protein TUSST3_12630 [Streptomyces sp. TUS-ST3]
MAGRLHRAGRSFERGRTLDHDRSRLSAHAAARAGTPTRTRGRGGMAEPEFTATGVRIGKRLRSLTRAGQVRINDGRLELLTSYGSEIDSAPVQAVRASKPWFAADDRALADLNGNRYLLTLGDHDPAPGEPGPPAARRFIEAVRRAAGRGD